MPTKKLVINQFSHCYLILFLVGIVYDEMVYNYCINIIARYINVLEHLDHNVNTCHFPYKFDYVIIISILNAQEIHDFSCVEMGLKKTTKITKKQNNSIRSLRALSTFSART